MERAYLAVLGATVICSCLMFVRALRVMTAPGDIRVYAIRLARLQSAIDWTFFAAMLAAATDIVGRVLGSWSGAAYQSCLEIVAIALLVGFGRLEKLRMKRVYPYAVNAFIGRRRR